jgi:hypothetical protein
MIVLRMMLRLSVLAFALALVNVAVSIMGTPVVVEVTAEIAILGPVCVTSGLIGVVLIDLLLDGREVAALISIRSAVRVVAR